MITGVVAAIVLALVFAVVIAIAKDRGPGPDDVAVSYELAWDRLDFESVFTLSGRELRDGRDRDAFVAAKEAAYEHQRALAGLVERVGIDEAAIGHEVAVDRDARRTARRFDRAPSRGARPPQRPWQVVAYRLTPSDEDTATASG